ncbi:kinase-like domain-containing protein [Gilbertella persicaria]|uniref:kinase-like domain-containing protein n=1 Tax=Gilbertella persicaria TaxID=101096 RepID=UPI00221F3158|nr:kinase-like domain-containing protein [Gilbertella persicaria]KAI8091185.1 kinase-like domain-containing protein [Gilbertella persicaria]
MERVDSIHSVDENKSPKPILVGSNHHARRSISSMDFLNGLKIMTNNVSNNNNYDNSIPVSPVPSHLVEHQFSQLDDFDLKEAIGYGSSAIVFKAIYKPLNKKMALKIIDLDKFERNQIDELRRETALMALSKHANVLRVYGSFVNGSKLYIVTPYLAGGSCLDIMKTRFPDGLDELSIATILKQTLEALIYLHKNGHIHRDVKAGNLLMDEDGTVMLADFGVSSSLMETGERGMRKTFVGTPCWMAPEVMEQAEYDYKADIWSFGITAIELATGHAPFAKYPPLKVLMMTLSNEPPTLDRETTVHKYSKTFKEMIDTCLSKDPQKRPSAEKLLQHPFFKQAKRKEYLVKTILSELPPLEQRPRKKIPQKQVTITKTDEWDFDDDNAEDDLAESNQLMPDQTELSSNLQENNSNNKAKPAAKRHISFGDVVVRSNSLVHPADPILNTPTTSLPSSLSQANPTPLSLNQTSTTPPTRKSRFVIEETATSRDQDSLHSTSVRSSSPMPVDEENFQSNTFDTTGEVMKGRFYVNQTPKPVTSSDSLSNLEEEQQQQQQQQQQLHKTPSQDYSDRKSRFEIQVNNNNNLPILYQPIPLSRDSSSYSSSSNKTTAIVEKKYPNAELLTTENIALLTESSRKIGRFELTGGSTTTSNSSSIADVTPRGSFSSNHFLDQEKGVHASQSQEHTVLHSHTPPNVHPQYQLEELIRMNEMQKTMLQELGSNLKKNMPQFFLNNNHQGDHYSDSQSSSCSVSDDLSSTVEHLDKLVQQTLFENAKLQRENENLRRELKELKLIERK